MTEPERPSHDAPERLIDDLSALYGAHVSTPPHIDAAMQALVQQKFTLNRRRRMAVRLAGVSAAAAAVALVVLLSPPADMPETAPLAGTSAISTAAPREDVDGNSRVDILDAFALARLIQGPADVSGEWDISGDGRVDRADVDLIAAAAVRLERG